MLSLAYTDYVFINCPFDDEYSSLLQAIIFTIYRCGFFPRCALGEDNGTDNRLDKIIRCIEGCKYGIHDISRTEINANNLPRFNMPFELGLFFGARKFGNEQQRNKNALIFERTKYEYQQYISDLNGIDTKAHNNQPALVVQKIREWLKTSSGRRTIPEHTALLRDYNDFMLRLPVIVKAMGIDLTNIPFVEYCQIVEEAVREKL